MDVQMPEVDGLQAAKIIRDWERLTQRKPTPIIALTASVLPQDRQDAYRAGMDGFASKPIDKAALYDEIARCLNWDTGHSRTPSAIEPTTDSSAETPVIDMTAAERRWGDKERLYKAIAQFSDDIKRNPLQQDRSNTQALAHRFKGAAANLGLDRVTQILAAIEQQQTPQPSLLQELAVALSAVDALLNQSGRETSSTNSGNSAGDASGNGTPKGDVPLALLERVADASKHSTIDDESLGQLKSLLSATHWSQLEDALDQFDFDTATDLLEQWMLSADWVKRHS
jgi:CheY-like chemotaxis protein